MANSAAAPGGSPIFVTSLLFFLPTFLDCWWHIHGGWGIEMAVGIVGSQYCNPQAVGGRFVSYFRTLGVLVICCPIRGPMIVTLTMMMVVAAI